jgi:hypothetical protein
MFNFPYLINLDINSIHQIDLLISTLQVFHEQKVKGKLGHKRKEKFLFWVSSIQLNYNLFDLVLPKSVS